MLLVAEVNEDLRLDVPEEELFGIEKLNVPRSTLPAITHVDHSARIQTVSEDMHPRYYALLRAFKEKTGCGVLINTSFNVRGEPIVCTAADAYLCFMRTGMDALVLEDLILYKEEQPPLVEFSAGQTQFELD